MAVDATLTAAEQAYFDQRGEVDPPGVDESASAPEETLEADSSPAPEAAPVVAEAEPKPDAKEETPRTVPLATMLEERREAKDRERRMEERFNLLVQRFAPPAEKPPEPQPIPGVDENPVENLRAANQQIADLRNQLSGIMQNGLPPTPDQQLVSAYNAHAQQFAQKQTDFGDAYAYWQNSIAQELSDAMGYADPQVITSEIQRFERSIAIKALNDGVNPAERLYNAAKRRGYAVKAAAKPEAQPDPEKQIETLRKGADASKSLGTSGGAPGESALSLKALADMPMEDFLAVSEKAFRRANLA